MDKLNICNIFIVFASLFFCGCTEKQEPVMTPWSTELKQDADPADDGNDSQYSVDELQQNGEMIALTITGPDTYYDYHGHGLGVQYMMCEDFASHIGVSLRVEVCRDTTEMINKLLKGEGDIIALPLSRHVKGAAKLRFCGAANPKTHAGWAVAAGNTSLADSINAWYKPDMLGKTQARENYLLSAASIRRHVYALYIDRSRGILSSYDAFFKRYAPEAGLDWHILAAQCYQESCYDPHAQSWAGASGLMQLMPQTAYRMGVPDGMLFDPEQNIAAGARYMGHLMAKLSDIPNHEDRVCFALASYNGGLGHVRDAQALARKYGGNPNQWSSVSQYILMLSNPAYYQDEVVKYGYMRGSETVNYVNSIRSRYGSF